MSIMAIGKFNWASSRYTDVNGKYPGGVLDNYYIQRESYLSGSLLYLPADGLTMDYSADWAINNLSSNLATDIRPYRNSVLQDFWLLNIQPAASPQWQERFIRFI